MPETFSFLFWLLWTIVYPSFASPHLISRTANYTNDVTAPLSNGGKAWAFAHNNTVALVAKMNLTEKVAVLTGVAGPCSGNTAAIERLGLPSLCLSDSPTGPKAAGGTQFSNSHATAATWNRTLFYERSFAMGQEFYDLGVHIPLSPVTGGPLGRSPFGGRSFEAWAADPYATGEAAYLSVKGLGDAGVIPTAKHWILYEQETSRNAYYTGPDGNGPVFPELAQYPISSNTDDRATHELYMWAFAEAIRAGTGFVMCSYNMINGTHACGHADSLNGLLKTELNFQGSVVSDWGAVWETMDATSGLDLFMPGSGYVDYELGNFFGDELFNLVTNGTISKERVDDQVIRTLTPYFAFGQAANPLPEYVSDTQYVNVQKHSTLDLVQQIGVESATLLKNTEGVLGLPLVSPQSLAVIGNDAIQSLSNCGNDWQDGQNDGCPAGTPNGTMSAGYGSGFTNPHNLITPLHAISQRAMETGIYITTNLNNSDLSDIPATVSIADACIVFVNTYTDEGYDRVNLLLDDSGEDVIEATAAVCPNTIVVVHNTGPITVESWIENDNVTAVVLAYTPGEQTGNSVVPILFGDVSPSGKLPYTIARNLSDYPPNTITWDQVAAPQANFTESLKIDYRWFDTYDIEPRFEFGFGLSYSTFSFGNITLEKVLEADSKAIQVTNEKFKAYKNASSLYDIVAQVSTTVENNGNLKAAEVAQLYISFPEKYEEPPKVLRGFEKTLLNPKESSVVTFPLRLKDLSVWNVEDQLWVLPKEPISIYVGNSSRNLPLNISFTA